MKSLLILINLKCSGHLSQGSVCNEIISPGYIEENSNESDPNKKFKKIVCKARTWML
jgi:hypothetical protein